MREIPLTQGRVALVDDDVYGHISDFKWHFSPISRLHQETPLNLEEPFLYLGTFLQFWLRVTVLRFSLRLSNLLPLI